MLTNGRVIQEQKNYYLVDVSMAEPVRAVLKGVVKQKQKRIAVGDFVDVEIFDGISDNAVIRKLHERKNFLQKPLMANIDNIFFMNCLINPALDLAYIDKFLFCAAVKNIPVTLVFNKIDILDEEELLDLQYLAEIYTKIGYTCLLTTNTQESSIAEVRKISKNKVSLFAGQSGVGKSSLMQILFPEEYFVTQELSAALLRGKNTTSNTNLLQIDGGGLIADTPGFSVFEMPNVEPQFVASYWEDFVEILQEQCCRFSNCSHKFEPDCAVKQAVEDGRIYSSRYENYIAILEEMEVRAKSFR